MPNFSQIRFQLVKISIFIVFHEVTIMKYERIACACALQQQHGHITHYTVQ